MDIRDKLLETVDANDPQFKILLNNTIQTEIKFLEEQLAAKRALNEKKRLNLNSLLQTRKALKKDIQEKMELLPVMEKASNCIQEYNIKLLKELTLLQNMVDDDSIIQLADIEREKKLLEKLEKKCNEYEAEFEKAPLAQELKIVNQELLKIEVELEMRKMNIKNMEDSYKTYKEIEKKREQQQIIEIAKLWLKHRDHVQESKKLREERTKLKEKLAQQEEQIQFLIKEKEDKDKQKLMARFQMPPPVMDTKFVETIFSQSHKLTTETKNTDTLIDNFSDSASICSSVLDEMCNVSEKTNTAATEVVPREIEPDLISLSRNEDSQCTRDSERSLQSPARFSRKSYDSRVKEINENLYWKKMEASKQNESSRVNTILKRNITVPENMSQNEESIEQSSPNLGTKRKVIAKRNRSVSIPKNVSGNDENEKCTNTGAGKKVKVGGNPCLTNKSAIEVLDISEDSVTIENDLRSVNHSLAGSYSSLRLTDSNNQQKDADPEYNSELSLQSIDDQNNSVAFTSDEMSNAENDVAMSEQNSLPKETSAPGPFGFFGNQKNRTINFEGLFK